MSSLAVGKAVSVQKPTATNLADGTAMVGAAERDSRLLKVPEAFAFHPLVRKAKALLDAGA